MPRQPPSEEVGDVSSVSSGLNFVADDLGKLVSSMSLSFSNWNENWVDSMLSTGSGPLCWSLSSSLPCQKLCDPEGELYDLKETL